MAKHVEKRADVRRDEKNIKIDSGEEEGRAVGDANNNK